MNSIKPTQKDLEDIKALAENFILALKSWEERAKETTVERDDATSNESLRHEQERSKSSESPKQFENDGINLLTTQPEEREEALQLQQVLQPDIQDPVDSERMETEAPSWVNSHILELSNTYGDAFEGFEKETLELLLRINERKAAMDKMNYKGTTTPRSRGIGKN